MGDDRHRLVETHLHLVHSVAGKLRRSFNRPLQTEDLVAYGSQGLLEAAERFDPTKGASFGTFAYYRIRGAMLDGMRSMGWYSRHDHAHYMAETRANELLQNLADREGASQGAPDVQEALESIAEILSDVAVVHITSLEAARDLPDESLPPPDRDLEEAQDHARVRNALATLPDRERRLLELHYFAGRSLLDAGKELGMSKSWASRLHTRAIRLLRKAIEEDAGCPENAGRVAAAARLSKL